MAHYLETEKSGEILGVMALLSEHLDHGSLEIFIEDPEANMFMF